MLYLENKVLNPRMEQNEEKASLIEKYFDKYNS